MEYDNKPDLHRDAVSCMTLFSALISAVRHRPGGWPRWGLSRDPCINNTLRLKTGGSCGPYGSLLPSMLWFPFRLPHRLAT